MPSIVGLTSACRTLRRATGVVPHSTPHSARQPAPHGLRSGGGGSVFGLQPRGGLIAAPWLLLQSRRAFLPLASARAQRDPELNSSTGGHEQRFTVLHLVKLMTSVGATLVAANAVLSVLMLPFLPLGPATTPPAPAASTTTTTHRRQQRVGAANEARSRAASAAAHNAADPAHAKQQHKRTAARFLWGVLRLSWALVDVPIRVVEWMLLGPPPLEPYRRSVDAPATTPVATTAAAAPAADRSGATRPQQDQADRRALLERASQLAALGQPQPLRGDEALLRFNTEGALLDPADQDACAQDEARLVRWTEELAGRWANRLNAHLAYFSSPPAAAARAAAQGFVPLRDAADGPATAAAAAAAAQPRTPAPAARARWGAPPPRAATTAAPPAALSKPRSVVIDMAAVTLAVFLVGSLAGRAVLEVQRRQGLERWRQLRAAGLTEDPRQVAYFGGKVPDAVPPGPLYPPGPFMAPYPLPRAAQAAAAPPPPAAASPAAAVEVAEEAAAEEEERAVEEQRQWWRQQQEQRWEQLEQLRERSEQRLQQLQQLQRREEAHEAPGAQAEEEPQPAKCDLPPACVVPPQCPVPPKCPIPPQCPIPPSPPPAGAPAPQPTTAGDPYLRHLQRSLLHGAAPTAPPATSTSPSSSPPSPTASGFTGELEALRAKVAAQEAAWRQGLEAEAAQLFELTAPWVIQRVVAPEQLRQYLLDHAPEEHAGSEGPVHPGMAARGPGEGAAAAGMEEQARRSDGTPAAGEEEGGVPPLGCCFTGMEGGGEGVAQGGKEEAAAADEEPHVQVTMEAIEGVSALAAAPAATTPPTAEPAAAATSSGVSVGNNVVVGPHSAFNGNVYPPPSSLSSSSRGTQPDSSGHVAVGAWRLLRPAPPGPNRVQLGVATPLTPEPARPAAAAATPAAAPREESLGASVAAAAASFRPSSAARSSEPAAAAIASPPSAPCGNAAAAREGAGDEVWVINGSVSTPVRRDLRARSSSSSSAASAAIGKVLEHQHQQHEGEGQQQRDHEAEVRRLQQGLLPRRGADADAGGGGAPSNKCGDAGGLAAYQMYRHSGRLFVRRVAHTAAAGSNDDATGAPVPDWVESSASTAASSAPASAAPTPSTEQEQQQEGKRTAAAITLGGAGDPHAAVLRALSSAAACTQARRAVAAPPTPSTSRWLAAANAAANAAAAASSPSPEFHSYTLQIRRGKVFLKRVDDDSGSDGTPASFSLGDRGGSSSAASASLYDPSFASFVSGARAEKWEEPRPAAAGPKPRAPSVSSPSPSPPQPAAPAPPPGPRRGPPRVHVHRGREIKVEGVELVRPPPPPPGAAAATGPEGTKREDEGYAAPVIVAPLGVRLRPVTQFEMQRCRSGDGGELLPGKREEGGDLLAAARRRRLGQRARSD